MPPSADAHFVPFGTSHVVAMLLIAAVAAVLPLALRRAGSDSAIRRVALGLGIALVGHELVKLWSRAFVYGHPIVESLPLQLCSVETLLVAFVLVRRSYAAFEIAYFWGVGGTLQALLTPDLADEFPSVGYWTYFVGHGLALVGVIFAIVVYRFWPTLRSVPKAILVTLAYGAAILPLNFVLGTNYLYLRHKPEQASLMDFMGPWPWYILSLVGVVIVSCFVWYLPFAVLERLSGRAERRALQDGGQTRRDLR